MVFSAFFKISAINYFPREFSVPTFFYMQITNMIFIHIHANLCLFLLKRVIKGIMKVLESIMRVMSFQGYEDLRMLIIVSLSGL